MLLGAAVIWRTSRSNPGPRPLPSEWALSARPVFSSDERRAFRQLKEALPHHVVLAKLPLVRFCQPVDPQEVRYWYEVLGATHVSFVICTAHGRVLAAIDLDNDRSNASRRSSQIKQAVLAACRVRYLRCPADHLPSIPELQLLVPQTASSARGPQAPAAAAHRMQDATVRKTSAAPEPFRRDPVTLWNDSAYLQDSFFNVDAHRRTIGQNRHAGLRTGTGTAMAGLDDAGGGGGIVIETQRHDDDDDNAAIPATVELPQLSAARPFSRPVSH